MLLIPKDPNDEKNVLLEVRAGTGGEEAALFAGDVFRMYARYAETHRWKLEILSQSDAEGGGMKEVVALISGQRVYSRRKWESGVHRVQRVPVTEAHPRSRPAPRQTRHPRRALGALPATPHQPCCC